MGKIFAVFSHNKSGTEGDQRHVREVGIQLGDKIELEDAYVYGSHTSIYLVGHEYPFNSVLFDFVDEQGRPYNIYRDRRFDALYQKRERWRWE